MEVTVTRIYGVGKDILNSSNERGRLKAAIWNAKQSIKDLKEKTDIMTLDKIKFYMDKNTFDFWMEDIKRYTHEEQKQTLLKAKETLTREIESGILKGIKYHAELKLINHLIS